MRRLIREPLLHFLALGALLFALYGWIHRGAAAPGEIVVTRGQVDALRTQFSRTWQREPTQQELQGLIDGWVRDEVLYREGRALGLDGDDPVIRRRVAQKVEFLAEDLTPEQPTDAELQAWLDGYADDYRIEARYWFEQVYFDPTRHTRGFENDIDAARHALAAGKTVSGDGTLLPRSMEGAGQSEVAKTFGTEFAHALDGLEVGEWSAPVESGLGIHLVRLTVRDPSRAARLDEARAAVERDLLHDRTEQGRRKFYAAMLAKYKVRVEDTGVSTIPGQVPDDVSTGGGAGAGQ